MINVQVLCWCLLLQRVTVFLLFPLIRESQFFFCYWLLFPRIRESQFFVVNLDSVSLQTELLFVDSWKQYSIMLGIHLYLVDSRDVVCEYIDMSWSIIHVFRNSCEISEDSCCEEYPHSINHVQNCTPENKALRGNTWLDFVNTINIENERFRFFHKHYLRRRSARTPNEL